jgi:hypothetical protein
MPDRPDIPEELAERLASDIAIWVGDDLIRRAGLESAPQELWSTPGLQRKKEEDGWLKGRDDTAALIGDELEGCIRRALEEPHALPALFESLRNQGAEEAERQIERLTIERDEARYSPMGDNHHNAAACPYCRPQFEAERNQALAKGAEEERERLREIVAQFHNDAVRSQIVREEQQEDSSVESIRVRELKEVLAALDTPAPSEGREPSEDDWACDTCGTIAPVETEGWEQTPQDDAGVTVERCPDCRLHPAPSEEDVWVCAKCGERRPVYAGRGVPHSHEGLPYKAIRSLPAPSEPEEGSK